MSKFSEPIPDGLVIREAGEWVKSKLDRVSRYIDLFETSMRDKWKYRCYIDLLSGCGKNKIRNTNEIVLGSPLIALQAKFPFTHYIFNELNKIYFDALSQRVEEYQQILSIELHNCDCNLIVDDVVNRINQLPKLSLNLAFIDPQGLDVRWDSIEKLARINKLDLLIFYPEEAINRNIKQFCDSDNDCKMDDFFGDRGWRKIYHNLSKSNSLRFKHRHLIDHYKNNLKKLGYVDFSNDHITEEEPLVVSTKTKAPLYRLIFASKHKIGSKFWKEIVKKDISGQKSLF